MFGGFQAECVSSQSREGGAEDALPSLWSFFLCVSGPLEHVHLSLPFVTTKNKEVNATAVLWPSQVGTLTYVWWYGNNTEVSWHSKWWPMTEVRLVLAGAKQNKIADVFESECSLSFKDSRPSVLKNLIRFFPSSTSVSLSPFPLSLLYSPLVFSRETFHDVTLSWDVRMGLIFIWKLLVEKKN